MEIIHTGHQKYLLQTKILYVKNNLWENGSVPPQHKQSGRTPLTKKLYKYTKRAYKPWTFHRPVDANPYIYNTSPGMPCQPPPNLRHIALDSSSPNIWKYINSSTKLFSSRTLTYQSTPCKKRKKKQLPTTNTPSSSYITIPLHLTKYLTPNTTYKLATDGNQINCSLTASWEIKLGETILKTGGKIPPGTANPIRIE